MDEISDFPSMGTRWYSVAALSWHARLQNTQGIRERILNRGVWASRHCSGTAGLRAGRPVAKAKDKRLAGRYRKVGRPSRPRSFSCCGRFRRRPLRARLCNPIANTRLVGDAVFQRSPAGGDALIGRQTFGKQKYILPGEVCAPSYEGAVRAPGSCFKETPQPGNATKIHDKDALEDVRMGPAYP